MAVHGRNSAHAFPWSAAGHDVALAAALALERVLSGFLNELHTQLQFSLRTSHAATTLLVLQTFPAQCRMGSFELKQVTRHWIKNNLHIFHIAYSIKEQASTATDQEPLPYGKWSADLWIVVEHRAICVHV